MYLLTRLIPFLTLVVVAGGTEVALVFPERFVNLISLTILIVSVLTLALSRRSTVRESAMFLTTMVTTLIGMGLTMFFLPSEWVRHFLVVVIAIGCWAFSEEVYRYVHEPRRYHQHAIERLTTTLGLVGLALSMVGIFALRIFLDVRLLYLLPATLALVVLICTAVLSAETLSTKKLWSSIAVMSILVTELTWVVNYLPTTSWVNSLVVTVPFYVALNLVRHEMNGTLTPGIVRRFVGLGFAALALVLVTTQWTI